MSDSETFIITHDPLDGLPIDLPEPMKARKTAKQIIAEVAAEFDVAAADILGDRKFARFTRPRKQAMRRIREELGYSYPRVGRIFNRHHTAILWACRGGRPSQSRRERAA